MLADSEAILRRFEAEVLDTFHTTLPLWPVERRKAIYALMAAFDTMILPMASILSETTSEDIGAMLHMKLWQEGFNQALLWLTTDGLVMPSPLEDGDLLDKGGEFLLYTAIKYTPVASLHVLYSRGLATVEADEKRRLVKFLHPTSGKNSKPWFNFAEMAVEGSKNRDEEQKKSIAMDEAMDSFANMQVKVEGGALRFDVYALLTPEVLRFADMVRHTETLILDPTIDLTGFSLGQFRTFWRILFAWSMSASMVFQGITQRGARQEGCIPTQVVPRDEFLSVIGTISGLSTAVVGEIVNRLSYIPGRKADIFLQPLLCSSDQI